MDKLIYTAMSGASASANRQAVLANNLANASTNGFRAELATYRAVPVRGDGISSRVLALEATAGHLDTPGPAQRTGRSLDALGDEFLAGVDVRVGGVADHDAGRLKAFGGDARVAFADQ